jgi:hypothetical protein
VRHASKMLSPSPHALFPTQPIIDAFSCAPLCIFSETLTLTSKNFDTQRSRQTDSPLFSSASRYWLGMHFLKQVSTSLQREGTVSTLSQINDDPVQFSKPRFCASLVSSTRPFAAPPIRRCSSNIRISFPILLIRLMHFGLLTG